MLKHITLKKRLKKHRIYNKLCTLICTKAHLQCLFQIFYGRHFYENNEGGEGSD